MSDLKLEAAIKYKDILDKIRIMNYDDFSVELFREEEDMSRPSADKIVKLLDNMQLIDRSKKSWRLCGNAYYFLGIGIGIKYVRVVMIDYNLSPVNMSTICNISDIETDYIHFIDDESDSFCLTFETPTEENDDFLTNLRGAISEIISFFLDRCSVSDLIKGIGFSVKGPVDYTSKIWISSCGITSIRDILITDIISKDAEEKILKRDIFLSIDNNTKAAAVSEYQNLLMINRGDFYDDLAVLHIEEGIGISIISAKQLYRGHNNCSGEIGQAKLLFKDATSESMKPRKLEDIVFDENKVLSANNVKAYLPRIMNIVNSAIGIQTFVLVSTSQRFDEPFDLLSFLQDNRFASSIPETGFHCYFMNGRCERATDAIGAAMESYFSMCNIKPRLQEQSTTAYSKISSRTNLARFIRWDV